MDSDGTIDTVRERFRCLLGVLGGLAYLEEVSQDLVHLRLAVHCAGGSIDPGLHYAMLCDNYAIDLQTILYSIELGCLSTLA